MVGIAAVPTTSSSSSPDRPYPGTVVAARKIAVDDAFQQQCYYAHYDRSNSRTNGPMTTKLKSIRVDVMVRDIIGGQQWSPSYINHRRRKAYKTVKTEDNGFTGGNSLTINGQQERRVDDASSVRSRRCVGFGTLVGDTVQIPSV